MKAPNQWFWEYVHRKVFVIYSIYKFIIEILDNVAVNFYNFASQYLAWIKKSDIESWKARQKQTLYSMLKNHYFHNILKNHQTYIYRHLLVVVGLRTKRLLIKLFYFWIISNFWIKHFQIEFT